MQLDIVQNPARRDLLRLAESGYVGALRDPATGDLYAWPATVALHADVADRLALPFRTRAELAWHSFLFSRRQIERAAVRDLAGLIAIVLSIASLG